MVERDEREVKFVLDVNRAWGARFAFCYVGCRISRRTECFVGRLQREFTERDMWPLSFSANLQSLWKPETIRRLAVYRIRYALR
jgi:hypothetical protein